MRNKAQHNKFVRFMSIPIRALSKARDFYVRSITGCAPRVGHSNPIGYPEMLPKSFSGSSARSNDNDDYRELIRAASARTLTDRIDMDMILMRQQRKVVNSSSSKDLPKSASVGMGRIDEDGPCDDFGKDVGVGVSVKSDLLYPRSRSYAVTKRSVMI